MVRPVVFSDRPAFFELNTSNVAMFLGLSNYPSKTGLLTPPSGDVGSYNVNLSFCIA